MPTAGTLSSAVAACWSASAPRPHHRAGARRAAGAPPARSTNAASLALALPARPAAEVRAVTEGYVLGGYAFTAYKHRKDGKARERRPPAEVVVLTAARPQEGDRRRLRGGAASSPRPWPTARDWVNTPAGDLRPPAFADAVEAAGSDFVKEHAHGRGAPKVGVTVGTRSSSPSRAAAASSASAAAPPRRPAWSSSTTPPRARTTHLALVGKGITFDSGGLSIKPAQGMARMKSDMAGAAAVVAGHLRDRRAAAAGQGHRVRRRWPRTCSAARATRPGDVLTIYGGTTVEVLNTDAEGRLVLADALVKAGEREPDLIVDVATLTGAMVVALGDRVAGVMGNEDVVARVLAAARGRRRGALADADPRARCTSGSAAARSPTWPSTTGSAGAAGCTPRRSCASSPADARGPTSTSPGRPFNSGSARRATSPPAAPASPWRPWSSSPAPWPTRPEPAGSAGLAELAALLLLRCFSRGCSRASAAGCRPPRRRTTAPGGGCRSRAPTPTDGTRRRVHSPSWATSSSVTSLTAVRGSTKPSTPRRASTNSSRCCSSTLVGGAHRVEPVRAPSLAGLRIRVRPPRRTGP